MPLKQNEREKISQKKKPIIGVEKPPKKEEASPFKKLFLIS
jgi:hypothetical protein